MSYVEVDNLKRDFIIKEGAFKKSVLRAVENVSFSINEGQALGLVGESGCGKSTLGRCMLRLIEPTGGSVRIEGQDICGLKGKDMRIFRSKMQMVFQDPYNSLNPRMTLRQTLREVLKFYTDYDEKKIDRQIQFEIDRVGLKKEYLDRYPHEFSGGQQQRIGVARALCTGAKFIVLDEPTSALDTSVKGQILSLLIDLKKSFSLTYLFITHDLSVLRYVCSQVAVMYLGSVVEIGDIESIFSTPAHPYTQALLSAIPIPDTDLKRNRIMLQGEIPSPINKPKGCCLFARCPQAKAICKEQRPELKEVGQGRKAACWLV